MRVFGPCSGSGDSRVADQSIGIISGKASRGPASFGPGTPSFRETVPPPTPILSDSVASGFFWYKAAHDGCKDAAGWQEGKGEWGEPQPALWFAKRQDTPPTPPTPPRCWE